jgi:hypothetical protein
MVGETDRSSTVQVVAIWPEVPSSSQAALAIKGRVNFEENFSIS